MLNLRVIKSKKDILLLCPNGSILKGDAKTLARLLTEFSNPKAFKGNYGTWNSFNTHMEKYPGETLAFVENKCLTIIYDKLFADLESETEYVSVSEYAEMHGKSRPMVKKLCLDGRIEGIKKHSTGWLIPKNAPYPERKPRESKPKNA